jgi:hypothetical protein
VSHAESSRHSGEGLLEAALFSSIQAPTLAFSLQHLPLDTRPANRRVTSFFVGHTELVALDWRRHSVSLRNPLVRAVFASESIRESPLFSPAPVRSGRFPTCGRCEPGRPQRAFRLLLDAI